MINLSNGNAETEAVKMEFNRDPDSMMAIRTSN